MSALLKSDIWNPDPLADELVSLSDFDLERLAARMSVQEKERLVDALMVETIAEKDREIADLEDENERLSDDCDEKNEEIEDLHERVENAEELLNNFKGAIASIQEWGK